MKYNKKIDSYLIKILFVCFIVSSNTIVLFPQYNMAVPGGFFLKKHEQPIRQILESIHPQLLPGKYAYENNKLYFRGTSNDLYRICILTEKIQKKLAAKLLVNKRSLTMFMSLLRNVLLNPDKRYYMLRGKHQGIIHEQYYGKQYRFFVKIIDSGKNAEKIVAVLAILSRKDAHKFYDIGDELIDQFADREMKDMVLNDVIEINGEQRKIEEVLSDFDLIDLLAQKNIISKVVNNVNKAKIFISDKRPKAQNLNKTEKALIKFGICNADELDLMKALYGKLKEDTKMLEFNPTELVLLWEYMILSNLYIKEHDKFRKIIEKLNTLKDSQAEPVNKKEIFAQPYQYQMSPQDKKAMIEECVQFHADEEVLIIGSGNAQAYIDLAKENPNTKFICVDRNPYNNARAVSILLDGGRKTPKNIQFVMNDIHSYILYDQRQDTQSDLPNFNKVINIEGDDNEINFRYAQSPELFQLISRILIKKGAILLTFREVGNGIPFFIIKANKGGLTFFRPYINFNIKKVYFRPSWNKHVKLNIYRIINAGAKPLRLNVEKTLVTSE